MKFAKILLAMMPLFLLASCRTAPIYNVNKTSAAEGGAKTLTLNQVRRAIVQAGSSTGWQMKPVRRGYMLGKYSISGHQAVVGIKYTRRTYSIHYVSSHRLKYNGRKIHVDYNRWVRKLNFAIKNYLYNS